MENLCIKKQFTRFLYPFRYSRSQTNLKDIVRTTSKGRQIAVFENFTQGAQGLRGGLSELLDKDGGTTKIADCYKLNNNCRESFGLPSKQTTTMDFFSRANKYTKPYRVKLNDVKLYLFESEVGFIDVEFEYESASLDDYMNCNYFICELKSDGNYFETIRREWNEAEKTTAEIKESFSMRDLVNKVLAHVGGVKDINSNEYPRFIDKGMIYSYLLLNKEPENISELLFNVRKNYKGSYKPPRERDEDILKHTRQQFENSYWTASYNGAVNVSYLTDDEITNSFFEQDFVFKMADTYFFLFINVLHQRYALIKSITDMGELDNLTKNYKVMKPQLEKANDYISAAANLHFRAFFLSPSNIEHINDYYELLLGVFEIELLNGSFEKDLNSVKQICDSYVSRIDARDDKFDARKDAKVAIFVSIIGTFVAVMTLLDSYWSLVEKILGKPVGILSPHVLLAILTLILPIITVVIEVVNKVKEIKKINKDLAKEIARGLVEDDDARLGKKK